MPEETKDTSFNNTQYCVNCMHSFYESYLTPVYCTNKDLIKYVAFSGNPKETIQVWVEGKRLAENIRKKPQCSEYVAKKRL